MPNRPAVRRATLLERIRAAWRALRGRCVTCGKRPGDDGRYGPIQRITIGICDQCAYYGES